MIKVMYSCNLCGLHKVTVEVEQRPSDQNVVKWVEKVLALAVSEDHDRRSPNCHPEKMSEIYIPMSGAQYIGGPAIQ